MLAKIENKVITKKLTIYGNLWDAEKVLKEDVHGFKMLRLVLGGISKA